MKPRESTSSSELSRDHRHSRFTSHAKTDAVLRLLKGESAESISNELGTTIARVERWKARYMAAGSAELARRTEERPKTWGARHWGTFRQWAWLLLALIAVVSILVLLLQRSPQD